MALQWKRNTRYPSVTRPGVFPRIQEFDAEGNDILEDTWFELTGIDEEEMNKFKFALGTWTQISRRNRKIRVLTADAANSITYPITDDSEESGTTEPKPNSPPEDFPTNIFDWAKNKAKELYEEEGLEAVNTSDEGVPERGVYDSMISKGDNGWISENFRAPLTGPGDGYRGKGFITNGKLFKVYKTDKTNIIIAVIYTAWYTVNITDPLWVHDLKFFYPSDGYQWVWLPSVSKITDPETGLTAFGEWIEGGSLIETQNQAGSDNQYVGLVTKSPIQYVSDIEQDDLFLYHEIGSDNYKDISAPLEIYFSLNYLEHDGDPVRSTDIVKYQVIEWGDEDTQMSDENILNSEFFYLYESDDSIFDGTKYKKLCLIAANAKEMPQLEVGGDGNANRGELDKHVYITPGVKTIKTIVMRFDNSGNFLLETSIVHTNIFIADPNQKIQDFNIFGAQDYSVLPLEEEFEPIIGNIDKRSEYVRSVEKIKNNDLYGKMDYLEKLYADEFLPRVQQDLYGEYAGNIDLGLTRVFKKPYNIFDFISGDALEIINNNFEYPQDSLPLNSSATEILISNGDCVVELNPSNQNNEQIENTGISDEKGILMGDFRLVKNPKQKIRKDGNMKTAKLNTKKNKQAF